MPSKSTFALLDAEAVQAIAAFFGVEPVVEPYSPDRTPVYRLALRAGADGLRLTLWPSLGRVDINRAGDHSWVLKNVGEIEVLPGVEVVFRPAEGRGYLHVSGNGFVNMVMG